MTFSSPTRLLLSAAVAAALLVVPGSDVARADGNPNVNLSKSMPAETLYGAPTDVTLTLNNPGGPDGFNASFNDTLPPGATYVTGSSNPEPLALVQGDGSTVLVWKNVADSLTGTTVKLSYKFLATTPDFEVGDIVTNSANVYVSADPRFLPVFNGMTGAATGGFTGFAAASATTALIPFILTKTEPSEEEELLRGVHDNQTVYTLRVDNNLVNTTNGFSIVDYLPAQLEFLGCPADPDNTTTGDEYATSGPIAVGAGVTLTHPCAVPSNVSTVTLDPDGPSPDGPLPSAVYTRVEWDSTSLATALTSADLAASGFFEIDYIAAIPLFENVQATLTNTGANLDNNTGALTTESETVVKNYAAATGDYNGTTSYTDDDYEQVFAEDISIHKRPSTDTFVQTDTPSFELFIENSEYALATDGIVVTDTLPTALDFVSATPAPDVVTAGPGGPGVLNADGTYTLTWTRPAFTAPNSTDSITVNTVVREFYRLGTGANGGPVSSNDSFTNLTALDTNVTIITDATGAAGAALFPLDDGSSASLSAGGPTILKEVSEPVVGTLTCGDGTGISFQPGTAGLYRPGDRVCWRLTVAFPANLDTVNSFVDDFLPAGFVYESWTTGGSNNVTILPADFSDAFDPKLTWDLPDDVDQGQVFQVVVQTRISDPNAAAPGDLLENLMKFRYSNTAGAVFQARDDALAEWAEPIVDLSKGVIAIDTVAVPGAPADGVTVESGDVVTYQLAVSNTGNEPALDVSVRDTLPPGIVCTTMVSAISNGGACGTGNWIQWDIADDIDLAAAPGPGNVVNLTYDITVSSGTSAGASLENLAGVRDYRAATNDPTAPVFTYVPANNIDTTLTPNTTRADDTSTIITTVPGITKVRTTSVNEGGNSTGNQATIGETVSYTVGVGVPKNLTYYNATITDTLDTEKDLQEATVVVTRDGVTVPGTFMVSTAANAITVTFPTPYNSSLTADEEFVITFDAVITDVSTNTRNTTTGNTATFAYENQGGTARSVAASVNTQIVEPNIVLSKSNNDPDGVVAASQTITYTLDVLNDDGTPDGSIPRVSTAHDTVVVDTVPQQLIVNAGSISPAPTSFVDGGGTGPSMITWTILALAPGASTPLTYQATTQNPLVAAGSLTNSAVATTTSMLGTPPGERSAASPNGDPGTGYEDPASSTVTVPVFTLTKGALPTIATVGETVTYTVDVTIPGGVIAYDVTVLDDLPAGITYESLTSVTCAEGAGACSPDITSASVSTDGDVVAFFFDDLVTAGAADRVVTITYVAYVADLAAANNSATLTNTARVYWNASDVITTPPGPTSPPAPGTFGPPSGPATASVGTVEPTLTIDKDVNGQNADDDNRRAKPGNVLDYTIIVANTGTSPAYNATVSDIPTDATWAFADTTAAAGVTNTDNTPAGGLAWTIDGPIAPGDSVMITYQLTVPATYNHLNEVAGYEQVNTADVPSYFAVPAATRALHPTRTFRDYNNVTEDVVSIELDLASIGDDVWIDLNNDGVQDSGEPPLANIDVVVTYLGLDNAPGGGDDEVFNTFTDPNGRYLVDKLPGGQYTVDVLESDPQFVAGLTPSYDLDGTTLTPNGAWAGTLGGNQAKRDVDFGYTGTGSIGDTIWFDQNLNGTKETNEAGITNVGVVVTWYGPDNALGGGDDIVYPAATTNSMGMYLVPNLPAGGYTVAVASGVPTGYNNVADPQGDNNNVSTLLLAAGQNNLVQDFGYAGTGSIGDYIWLDQNGDGVQDGTEPGTGGVTVVLTSFGPDNVLGGPDDSTFTTTTDPTGHYTFTNLPPGEYRVAVIGGLPANVTNSFDPDTTAPGNSTSRVTLGLGENNVLQDFGYAATSVLGDRVWWDIDKDGVQDVGEPGINGVTVTATYLGADNVVGGGDDIVFTTTTSGSGDYLFSNIPDGQYIVAVTAGIDSGFDATYDEDSGLASPNQRTGVTLVASHLTADFGYSGTGSIGDTVWLDVDGDGSVNGGETGLPGVTVKLTWYGADGVAGGTDNIVLTTTTVGPNGTYLFDNLPSGNFVVDVDTSSLPAGLNATYDSDGGIAAPNSSTPVALAVGQDIDTVDFGYNGAGTIGDTIWFDRDGDGLFDPDEYPLEGVGVTLTWASPTGPQVYNTTTAANGTYIFPNRPPGDYTVTVVTATLPPGFNPTFDASGPVDSESTLTLADGESNLVQDFGYNGVGSIGETIWLDLNGNGVIDPGEPGVPNQTVQLTWQSPSGPVMFTTTTDATGMYLFDNLPDGDYTITVIGGIVDAATNTGDPGSNGDSTNDLTLSGGVPNLDQNFGYQGNNSLGDQIWWDQNADGVFDGTEPGVANIEVIVVWFGPDGAAGGGDDITLPTTTTSATGVYGVGNLPDGSYSVTVTNGLPPGLTTNTFDADDGTITSPGTPNGTSIVTGLGAGTTAPVVELGQDFGYAGSGSIGDRIWLDRDGDGAQDPGEPGIPGAQITLTWSGPDNILGNADDVVYPAQTTGANGTYLFPNLPAGPFRVDVANLPAGISPTGDPDGGNDNTAQLSLTTGESNLAQDFGYRGTASVGDTIWLDLNGDGDQDPGEPGLPGITVTVTSPGSDGVLGGGDDIVITVDTGADGTYVVDGLPTGPTSVRYDTGDLGTGLVPKSDLDGGDVTITTVTLAANDAPRNVDFGVVGDASLGGVVFNDADGNGVQGPNEPGLGGVTVIVTWAGPNGPVVIPVATAPDGTWTLPSIPPGTYTVTVDPTTVPPGVLPSTPKTVTVTVPPGGTVVVVNGYVPAGSIGDRVWNDVDRDGVQDPGEPGASGVTVILKDSTGTTITTTVTGPDGAYSFPGLPPGNYTVELDPATLRPGVIVVFDPDGGTPNGVAPVTLGPGQDITTIDFGIASPAPLPSTGRDIARVLLLAGVVMGLGWLLVGATRRRRLTT